MDAQIAIEPALCSDQTDKLIEALAVAAQTFGVVVKDRENTHFRSKYASLDALQTATRTPLAANGLIVAQLIRSSAQAIALHTRLAHVSGQWMQSVVPLSGAAKGPQVFGSELTFLKRYLYAAILNISADEDDDAAASQQPVAPSHNRDRPPQRPPADAQKQKRSIKDWLFDLERD